MISLEEKVKLTSEENIGLKSYIERMNSECMELNATLFEEANRMVSEKKLDIYCNFFSMVIWLK